jgi:hypothetical protein
LGRTLDTFVGLFLGRPDKYWSWAAASALFVGLGFFIVLYGGVPISEAFPVGETIIGFGLPLLLVPLRMKWGWPRG